MTEVVDVPKIQNESVSSNNPIKVNDTVDPQDHGSTMFPIRSIQYPQDIDNIGDNSFQRHFIRFTMNLDEESKLIKKNKISATDVDNTDQNRIRNGKIDQGRLNVLGASAGAAIAGGSGTLGAVLAKMKGGVFKKAAVGAGAAAIGAGAGYLIADNFDISKKLKKLAATITLYNPGNLQAGYNMSYQLSDDKLAELLKTGKGEELLKDTNSQDTSVSSAASKITRILGTASSDLVQNLTRTVQNDKKDMLFRQVENRTFQFEYLFMPKNPEESYDIANIIYMLKYFAHPEMIEGYDQYLFIYPAEFDIEYVYKQGKTETNNIWLNKISSCVLESINITYSPGGSYQSLAMGEPCVTAMTLRFREIESLHRDRIAKGY